MSQLLPEGIDHLGDAPHTLHFAITNALRVLNYEEFPIDERPPKRIWMDGERLNEHWETVEERRKAQLKGAPPDEPDGEGEENSVELIKRG